MSIDSRQVIKVGDTVTIKDYECDGEYTVLAINPDPESGYVEGFAWLAAPGKSYCTHAVEYLTLKRKPEYTVEFYFDQTDLYCKNPYHFNRYTTEADLHKKLSILRIADDEVVVIRKE